MRTNVMFVVIGLCAVLLAGCATHPTGGWRLGAGKTYHVAVTGSDANDGSATRPLRTISAAARLAQPGQTIVVHEGIYRERINPPRGGTGPNRRITYQAAPGETVVIAGSEPVSGWKRNAQGLWSVRLPNTFFGDYNPYKEVIHGDWFRPRGRVHHTGEVYLDGRALAEDREQFSAMVSKLSLRQPENSMAASVAEALERAGRIGYPVMVRPSYVLGGRAMDIIYTEQELRHFVDYALDASDGAPVLIDKFLEEAIELDVDAVADGRDIYIAGILEHIEYAGVHSGDAAMALPPQRLPADVIEEICRATRALAMELDVRGLMNIQFAVVGGRELYVLEVNPRASRTVPFVSKVTGVPIAKVATRVMLGETLASMGLDEPAAPLEHVGVKESVFPFNRFPGVDAVLGPEMRSTGEVMGLDRDFGLAFAKSQIAAGMRLPTGGTAFVSVKDADKPAVLPAIRRLKAMGFELLATGGTSEFLNRHRVANRRINKVREGRPHVVDAIKNGDIDLIINTPSGRRPRRGRRPGRKRPQAGGLRW